MANLKENSFTIDELRQINERLTIIKETQTEVIEVYKIIVDSMRRQIESLEHKVADHEISAQVKDLQIDLMSEGGISG